jgi:hypothetical protein
MKCRDQIQYVIFAISPLAYFPFSQWISTTYYGTTLFLWLQAIFVLPLFAAILVTPILIVLLLFKRTRRRWSFLLMVSILFIPCCIGGIVLGHKARRLGMQRFAQRSQSLVAAIKEYERDRSSPPHSLEDLVPGYLPVIPSTGMMAYPEYRYCAGEKAKKYYADNPWALTVSTPSGGINFDMMLYFPEQNYPERGYGGSLERLGGWAYVHE